MGDKSVEEIKQRIETEYRHVVSVDTESTMLADLTALLTALTASQQEIARLAERVKEHCGCNCHDLCKVPEASCEEHQTCAECFRAVCEEYEAAENKFIEEITELQQEIIRLKDKLSGAADARRMEQMRNLQTGS